jgi:hypothetical protein
MQAVGAWPLRGDVASPLGFDLAGDGGDAAPRGPTHAHGPGVATGARGDGGDDRDPARL